MSKGVSEWTRGDNGDLNSTLHIKPQKRELLNTVEGQTDDKARNIDRTLC